MLHRALGQLAQRAAGAGFATLRFDWGGCGDSAGDAQRFQLADWRADFDAAVGELHRRSPRLDRIVVAGVRLGATVAILAAAKGRAAAGPPADHTAGLIAIDPVIDGRRYVAELDALHGEMLRRAHVAPDPIEARGDSHERLGFPFPHAFATELRSIDLSANPCLPAPASLLLGTRPDKGRAALAAQWRTLGGEVDEALLPAPDLWRFEEDLARQLVPFHAIDRAVRWLETRHGG